MFFSRMPITYKIRKFMLESEYWYYLLTVFQYFKIILEHFGLTKVLVYTEYFSVMG